MASNPAFNRLEKDAQSGYAGFGGRGSANPGNVSYAQQGTTDQWGSQQQLQDMYNSPSAGPTDTGRVTMDDVIMKTMGLFALVLVFGAAGWIFAAQSQGLGFMLAMGGMIGTLVLGLVIAFKKTLSVPLIVAYAVLEGLFVGAISQIFEARWEGVVPTAALATAATFTGMFLAYKSGLIKVTDKFRRIVTMMVIGYAIFAFINYLILPLFFTDSIFGIGGTTGILISLFAVGLASVSLALDFDMIDRAIATGAPQKYSWLLAHGLIVTVVWLYIEFLRLFARMRE
jgi:uncharacterized YccA/Bax inhibitor family protein